MSAKRGRFQKEIRIGEGIVRNKILTGLPKAECQNLFSRLEFVDLPLHSVLAEACENVQFGHFVNSGLASVLNLVANGRSVEVGLFGVDGFVGYPLVVGLRTSSTKIIMQVAGSAFRIRARELAASFKDCPVLRKTLQVEQHVISMQASQVAACNRMHSIDQRLARWLLMSQDTLGGDIVPLTQEFLSHMLGTRRAISYQRGVVVVKNRFALEKWTCECYRAIVDQTQRWRSEAKD